MESSALLFCMAVVPPGENKTQLYPPLLKCERILLPGPVLSHPLPKPCWWASRPCRMLLGQEEGASRRGLLTSEVSTSSDAPGVCRKQDAPSVWGGRKEICLSWLCREDRLGLKYIMRTYIFKVTVVHMWHVCQTMTENKKWMSFWQFENYTCGMYVFWQCPFVLHA